ncbi:MAG TPA: trigger factor [Lachnospiraceae bacterium]|nr:trigger factor [Lachnospiraceae bacterium]HAP72852.1 trigger factor [Lachnospiraceae bacterium]HBH70254.1 trigger factor [Lachnospiraceae bacterium]
MNVTVEKLEKGMAKLTITVTADVVAEAEDKVYKRQKNQISIPGFRKGKAPKKIIEKMYGEGVFLSDAINDVINETYPDAVKECGEEIVSNPKIDLSQAEPGKDLVYTAEVALKPEVKLGKYKGVEIEKLEAPKVSEEDIEKELKRQQDANAKIVDVTDRPVQNGDMIKLDFAGTVDGEAFEGGKAENYDLTIGSGSFIPGFEDQLVGMNIGEEKDVNVTFPEDYGQKDLAGKAAVFACKVNAIKEKKLPELNDEFADEVSEFSTLDEYKKDIEKNLLVRAEEQYKQTKENAAVAAAVADADIEIPDAMLETQAESLVNEFAQNLQMQGMNIDMYLQYTGLQKDQLVEQFKPQAKTRIQNSLVLEAVAKAENIEASDEDLAAEYEKMAAQYNMPVDNIKKVFGESEQYKDDMKKDIALRKAAELIAANAKETKEAKKADEEKEKPAKRTRKSSKKAEEAAQENAEQSND